jgi:hypothetical protein
VHSQYGNVFVHLLNFTSMNSLLLFFSNAYTEIRLLPANMGNFMPNHAPPALAKAGVSLLLPFGKGRRGVSQPDGGREEKRDRQILIC